MGRRNRRWVSQSPLLALPLVAMFVFLLVWIVTSIHALTRPRAEIAALASLPLHDGTENGEPR